VKKIFVGNLDIRATEDSIRTLFEPWGGVESINLVTDRTLRQQGVLNAHPDAVTDPLFQTGDFFDARDLVQVRWPVLK